jgi:hypothetical protein
MPVKLITRVNIGNVNFEDRSFEGLERIEHCDRCERIGGRIDDQRVRMLTRRLDKIDQIAFMV